MPPHLLMMLADGFLDRLFNTSNDLVVDVHSMGAIDPTVGGFIDDTLDFGTNRLVYHCNYFVRPETSAALRHWLALPQPQPPSARRRPGSAVRSVSHQHLSAGTNTNFIEVDPDATGNAVAAAVHSSGAEYVIIRRPRSEGGYAYAFHRDEVLTATRGRHADEPVRGSLELGEHRASGNSRGPNWIGPAGWSDFPTTMRTIIFAGSEPAGVLPEAQPPPPLSAIPAGTPPPARDGRASRSGARRPGTRPAGRRSAPSSGTRANGEDGGSHPGSTRASPPPPSRRRTSPPAARRAVAPPTTPYVFADMPPEVLVGQQVTVHVEISADELARATGTAAKAGKVADAFDPSKPLLVQVLARTNFEVVGDNRATVDAPGPGDPSVELFFDVVATHAGTGEVWVTIRQGAPTLLTLTLQPEITVAVGATVTPPRARGPARAKSLLPATVPTGWSMPTLRVHERTSGNSTVYEYDLDLLEEGTYQYSSAPLGDRDTYVNGIYQHLEETWANTDQDIRKFRNEVRAYGGELFDELFPDELQRLLWKHRSKLKNIRVLSTEPFIPWELIHLKNPATGLLPAATIYLAQMGLVRWLANTPGAPAQLQIRPGKAWYVVPDYPDQRWALAETATEAAFLADTFQAQPVPPRTDRVMALLKRRDRVDLFHFAGHGGATGGDVQDARIYLQGRIDPEPPTGTDPYITDELAARSIRQEGRIANPEDPVRPLVVLNACQAGRAGMQLTSIGGFADAFLHAGAGAFISSLWSVGDYPAATFTTEFYEQLKQGCTIAEATVSARETARAAGDATWLAYVVYAHPDAKLI